MKNLSSHILLLYRSAQMGELLRQQLVKIRQQFPNFIKEVRGKGLFNAVELDSKALSPITAYDICLKLKERGILAKPTHDSIIRLTPPLCMRYTRFMIDDCTIVSACYFVIDSVHVKALFLFVVMSSTRYVLSKWPHCVETLNI